MLDTEWWLNESPGMADSLRSGVRRVLARVLVAVAFVATALPASADLYDDDVARLRATNFDPAPYSAGAQAGDAEALYNLAIIEDEANFDFDTAFTLFEQAAAVGHAGAQYRLGRYQVRFGGDLAYARTMLQAAAQNGHPDAAALLAEIGGSVATSPAPAPVTSAPPPVVAQAPSAPAALPSNCVDPATVNDNDVARLAGTLRDAGLCVRQEHASDGGLDWTFTVIENLTVPGGPVWFLPHDNENAAFDTAVHAVRNHGGRLIAVEAADNRSFRGQDPNRNFGRTAEVAASCRDQRAAAPNYTDYVMAYLKPAPVAYLSLHSNDPGYNGDGRGGAGTISVFRKSSVMRGFPAPNPPSSAFRNGDNAVLFAGTEAYGSSSDAQRKRAAVNDAGMNAIYEHVTWSRNDCSLSNYILLNFNDKPYYNVEAQHGDVATQIAMVEKLLPLIGFGPGAAAAAPVEIRVPRLRPDRVSAVPAPEEEPSVVVEPLPDAGAVTIDPSGAVTAVQAPSAKDTDRVPPAVSITGGSLEDALPIGEDGISDILPGLLEEGSSDGAFAPVPDASRIARLAPAEPAAGDGPTNGEAVSLAPVEPAPQPEPAQPTSLQAERTSPLGLLGETQTQLGLLAGLAIILMGLLVISPMRRRKHRPPPRGGRYGE